MKKLKEEEIVTNIDDKITEIISYLSDNSFGNSESRKHFSVCMHQLAISRDPRARKLIRQLGNSLTSLGQDLLSIPVENHELGNNFKTMESKVKKYKSIFSEVTKTKSAKKVLQLMDAEEDPNLSKIIKDVSKEDGISVKQLEKELNPWI